MNKVKATVIKSTVSETTKQIHKETAEKEWTQLEELTRYMNYDESAEVVLGYVIEDREKTGNGFVEVLREGTGKPAGIEYLDAQYLRVCKLSDPLTSNSDTQKTAK